MSSAEPQLIEISADEDQWVVTFESKPGHASVRISIPVVREATDDANLIKVAQHGVALELREAAKASERWVLPDEVFASLKKAKPEKKAKGTR